MNKLVCEECGSDEVQQKVWMNPNNSSEYEHIETTDDEDNWCKKCNNHVQLVYEKDYE